MSIAKLKNQILSQGTVNQWSGQGHGSAEANAEDMAKILDSIGITDIRQFGPIPKYETIEQIGFTLNGRAVQNPRPGLFYVMDTVDTGDGFDYVRRDLNPSEAAQVKPVYGVQTGTGEYNEPIYRTVDATNVTTRDGKLVGITGETFGNKVTGQEVPNTYSERQTGNAWGGTFAGKGNTGYRVDFAPDGTPVFYTTAASSKDKTLTTLAPMIAMALPFAAPALVGSIGSILAPTASAAVQTGIGNAIVQGAMSELQGGDFLKGAALSGVNSLAGGLQPGLSEALGGGATGNVLADALIGGTMAELSGGEFGQGAVISGIGSGINQAKLAAADEYLSNIPVEAYDTATLPTELDVIEAFPELNPASFQIGDTTFTPDYSLGRGTSGAPGLTVAPITTEYKVGSFDYSLGELLDGLGLKMPSVPNIAAMGGGQGIVIKTTDGYITEGGFVPNSYIASLGDPESFINKPVVDVQLSLSELQSTNEADLNQKLAGLDVARALTPYALAALTKKAYDLSREDNTSGFAMVPIPTDWRSPEYNMAFTPSAPIDFGSVGMLAGTQFANPAAQPRQMDYSLSDVINTLNFQAVPFVQQQYEMPVQEFTVPDILQQFQSNPNVAMSDIIGQLDNAPASLNSIIAGIQSQYG